MKRKVIFFDRDGTLIEDKIYLNDPQQIVYLPGVFDALKRLRDAGFDFCVVTNQSGVPRGLVQIENLEEIHRVIRADFARRGIDFLGFYYAPFMTNSDHFYRKPNPGMLLQGQFEFNIDLKNSWIVGDRMTDIEAGRRIGVKGVLLRGVETSVGSEFEPPTAEVDRLEEMADAILRISK